ncbi:MAG: putative peptidoglycan-binding domain-containing protein [Rickettsiales bacterium]
MSNNLSRYEMGSIANAAIRLITNPNDPHATESLVNVLRSNDIHVNVHFVEAMRRSAASGNFNTPEKQHAAFLNLMDGVDGNLFSGPLHKYAKENYSSATFAPRQTVVVQQAAPVYSREQRAADEAAFNAAMYQDMLQGGAVIQAALRADAGELSGDNRVMDSSNQRLRDGTPTSDRPPRLQLPARVTGITQSTTAATAAGQQTQNAIAATRELPNILPEQRSQLSPSLQNISKAEVRELQQSLRDKGFDIAVDGCIGPETLGALQQAADKATYSAAEREQGMHLNLAAAETTLTTIKSDIAELPDNRLDASRTSAPEAGSPATTQAAATPAAPAPAEPTQQATNNLDSYFDALETRIERNGPVAAREIVGRLDVMSGITSDTRYDTDKLRTAERNIAAAFDTDGVEGLSKTELGTMQAYVERHGDAMDTAGELLGHFSAPTFRSAGMDKEGASVSV